MRVLRRIRGDALIVQEQFAAIGFNCARDDFDERRFARAVFANERVNLARAQCKRSRLERLDARVGFGDGLSFEHENTSNQKAKGKYQKAKGRHLIFSICFLSVAMTTFRNLKKDGFASE
jgi:hypothetical protein